MFVERDREIDICLSMVDGAERGRGGALLLSGAAGIGKTTVMEALCTAASARGLRVLTAAGGEFERDLPFAVARHLFEPTVRALDEEARRDILGGTAGLAGLLFGGDVPADATVTSVIHGLYWVCSNLCAGPMIIAVDDAHWADEASLRFLSHLVRRVADLPILVALGARPVKASHALARALERADFTELSLEALSPQGVSEVVRDAFEGQAEDEFCAACAQATQGNPFLLAETLRSLRDRQIAPTAQQAGQVEDLPVEAIARSVSTRLARIGPDAARIAEAVAILGPSADPRRAALLARTPVAEAGALLEKMAAEQIIALDRPVRFVHPLVRAAVYGDIGQYTLAADHKRAARLLDADGLPADLLIPHLLAAEPEGDGWVVERLQSIARASAAAPDIAAACLRRALAEPVQAEQRPAMLADLGRALGRANRPDEAADALRQAAAATADPVTQADVAVELGALMIHTGRAAESLAALDLARQALDGVGNSERFSAMYALALSAMEPPHTWIAELERLVAANPTPDRMLLANLAYGASITGDRPAGEVAALALRAADGPIPTGQSWQLVNFAGVALAIADHIPEALELLDRGLQAARVRGDSAVFRYLSILRSHAALVGGRLMEAEADAQAALALSRDDGTEDVPLSVAVLVDALVDRGELDEAQRLLAASGLEGDIQMTIVIAHFVVLARGRLRLRQHRAAEALADFLAVGQTVEAAGCVNPGFTPWRTEAALAHLQLGDVASARALATEDLRLARAFGAPRSIGLALHTLGLVEGRADGLALLAESVSTHRHSPGQLDVARALLDYGSALRRDGRRSQSLEPLREALDIATRQGATALARRAGDELIAAGARPRRAQLTGPAALTASELRVARLAAQGSTNREIAQALFVSLRTVEIHLSHTYRKLGIDTRHRLAAALEGE